MQYTVTRNFNWKKASTTLYGTVADYERLRV